MIAACREGVAVLGIGSHVPDRVMTNDEIATMVDTNDEWISQRTGIAFARIVSASGRALTVAIRVSFASISCEISQTHGPITRPAREFRPP